MGRSIRQDREDSLLPQERVALHLEHICFMNSPGAEEAEAEAEDLR